jgi:hypothetical protein
MVLAERLGDANMAETALSQINTAFETMRDSGDALGAAYFEAWLPIARALAARLRGRCAASSYRRGVFLREKPAHANVSIRLLRPRA